MAGVPHGTCELKSDVEKRPVGDLPRFGFFWLPRKFPRRLESESQTEMQQFSVKPSNVWEHPMPSHLRPLFSPTFRFTTLLPLTAHPSTHRPRQQSLNCQSNIQFCAFLHSKTPLTSLRLMHRIRPQHFPHYRSEQPPSLSL